MLWIGTNKLDILSLEEPVFKTINTTSKIKLNNDFVFSIFKTNKYLFIGTRNGLNCIDNAGTVTAITKENTGNTLADNVIRGINRDCSGHLWLATAKGISVLNLKNFNPQKPAIKSIFYDHKNSSSLSNNNTRSIYIDHKNRIWIATFGGGINLFTGNIKNNDFSFIRYSHKHNKNSINSDLTYNISQDTDNNYWITTKSGLTRLNFINGDITKPEFKVFDKKNGLFNANNALTTYQDSINDIIWIGNHSGLYRFNRKKQSFKGYDKKDGLTSSVVYSILYQFN